MKKLIFILLKIGEVLLIPVFYILCSLIGKFISGFMGDDINFFHIDAFLIGLFTSVLIATIFLLIDLLRPYFMTWIESNKALAEKIYNKLKK